MAKDFDAFLAGVAVLAVFAAVDAAFTLVAGAVSLAFFGGAGAFTFFGAVFGAAADGFTFVPGFVAALFLAAGTSMTAPFALDLLAMVFGGAAFGARAGTAGTFFPLEPGAARAGRLVLGFAVDVDILNHRMNVLNELSESKGQYNQSTGLSKPPAFPTPKFARRKP